MIKRGAGETEDHRANLIEYSQAKVTVELIRRGNKEGRQEGRSPGMWIS